MFGSTLIMWNFGGWKTFWVEAETYERAWKNKDYLVISNIPFERADHFYNSRDDFVKVLNYLYYYYQISNNELDVIWKYKSIIFIMDECHLYFPSRQSMDKTRAKEWYKLNTVLTQCRKRKTKFNFITQRLQKTDIEFRRLSEFIYYYNMNYFFWLPINRLSIIRAGGGLSDLTWEDWTTRENVEQIKEDTVYTWIAKHNTFFFRSELKMKHKDRPLRKEHKLTNFICWVKPIDPITWEFLTADSDQYQNVFNISREEFYKTLLISPSLIKPIYQIKNKYWIPKLTIWKKYYDYENSKKLFDFRKKTYKIEYV